MAIGDAFGVFLSSVSNHQPSSGVEQALRQYVNQYGNDSASMYNGSFTFPIKNNTSRAGQAYNSTGVTSQMYRMCIMIDNTNYIRKTTSSSNLFFGGIQTNS
jgi:hypothetical protein